MTRSRAYLGLGGNLGDPRAAMTEALRIIDASPDTRVAKVSSLYRTPPWGNPDQPDFLNAAAEISTGLSPRALLDLCLHTEHELKRVRAERWGPRLIDIDILLFGSLAVKEQGLEIPHPRLTERAFALVPLAEIAPGLAIGGKPLKTILRLVDQQGFEKVESGRAWWTANRESGSR